MRSKYGTEKEVFWTSLRRSLPVWAASMKKRWWMPTLEHRLYPEGQKGRETPLQMTRVPEQSKEIRKEIPLGEGGSMWQLQRGIMAENGVP